MIGALSNLRWRLFCAVGNIFVIAEQRQELLAAMPRSMLPTSRSSRGLPIITEPSADGKIVPLRLTVLPRHRAYLLAWLQAGGRMGLCDADVASGADTEVYVWVRENPDPAYAVRAEGMSWVVVDHLRGRKLGAFRSFEAALYCIRPVTPDTIAA